jgi:hypothetical protein
MVRIFGRTYDRAPVPALSVQVLKRRLDQGEDLVAARWP